METVMIDYFIKHCIGLRILDNLRAVLSCPVFLCFSVDPNSKTSIYTSILGCWNNGWLSVIICHLISLNTASKQPNAQGTWCSHPVSRGLSARTPPSVLKKRRSKLWLRNQGSMFWPRKGDKGSSKFYQNPDVFAACSKCWQYVGWASK